MSQEETREESQSLGSFLRDHRTTKALSLEDACESTKISIPILRAIEEDDYDRMPAETFRRAFYSMYAKFLDLDPEDILARYLESGGLSASPSNKQKHPPVKKSGKFSSYAEPAPVSPVTSLGIVLAICLISISALCWYFNWNPFSSLSSLLDSPLPSVQEESAQPAPVTETFPEETAVGNGSTVLPLQQEERSQPEPGATSPFTLLKENDLDSSDPSRDAR